MRHSDAFALFPGGFGTLDEGFEALTLMQTGKSQLIPLVLLDRPGGTYWKTWEQHVREKPAARRPHFPGGFEFVPHRERCRRRRKCHHPGFIGTIIRTVL